MPPSPSDWAWRWLLASFQLAALFLLSFLVSIQNNRFHDPWYICPSSTFIVVLCSPPPPHPLYTPIGSFIIPNSLLSVSLTCVYVYDIISDFIYEIETVIF